MRATNASPAYIGILGSGSNTLGIWKPTGSLSGAPDISLTSTGNLGIASTTPWAKLSITNTGTGPSFIVEDSTSPDTTPFIIDASGNVGIGTTGPFGKLTVKAGTNQNFDVTGNTTLASGVTLRVFNDPASVNVPLQIDASQVLFNGGNVGIGTGVTTPSARLQVTGVSGGTSAIFGDNVNSTLAISHSSGSVVNVFGTAGSSLSLGANNTEVVRIASGGNVGIASTTPWAKLSITNTGTGPSFVVEDSTSPDTSPFIIDASGNVGIGTTGPSGLLHLYGPITGDGQLNIQSSAGTGLASNHLIEFNDSAGSRQAYIYKEATSGKFGIFNDQASAITTVDNVLNVLSGNVGINTTNPTYKLDVSGLGRFTGLVDAANFVATSTSATSTFAGGITGPGSFTVQSSSGYVGIGTTSPAELLHLSGSGAAKGVLVETTSAHSPFFEASYNSASVRTRLQSNSSNGWVGTLSNHDFRLMANSAEQVRIAVGGNVGIGSTTPFAKLSVQGAGTGTGINFQTTNSSQSPLFSILDNGNVGIGAASPQLKAHVYGAVAAPSLSSAVGLLRLDTSSTIGLDFGVDSSSPNAAWLQARWMTGVGSYPLSLNPLGGNVGIGTTTPGARLHVVTTSGSQARFAFDLNNYTEVNYDGLNTVGGAQLFKINGSEKMRIDSTGNVGIGTTSPLYGLDVRGALVGFSVDTPLHVTSDANYTGIFLDATQSGGTGQANLFFGKNGAKSFQLGSDLSANGTKDFFLWDSTNAATRLYVGASGNLGLGTTNPTYKFDLSSSGNGLLARFLGSAATHGVAISTTTTGYTNLRVFDGGGRNVNIVSHPNDLTTSDAYLAGIASGLGSGVSLSTPVNADSNHLTLRARGDIALYTNSGSTALNERMRLTSGGSLGLATSSPWRTLSVTGTVGFDGLTGSTGAGSLCLDANKQVVYNSASDSCLSSTRDTKHDIQPLTLDALGMIEGLDPVSFVYNEGGGRTRFGFIAEDTAAIDPHLATYNASGTVSGIDDRAILSILVAAIKSIASQVRDLATTVANFAESFTTKELIATNGTFESVATKQLCAIKSDGTRVCLTGDQLGALLSQTAAAAASVSVPSSPSKIREPEPPISVSSSSTPDVATSTPEALPPEPANDNPSFPEASSTSEASDF